MSENPYQPVNDAGNEDDLAGYETPSRTSLLAVFSLLLAIPCCVPGAGLLAATLGGVSLGLIRNARGRLSGKAPAIIAIFVGLFVTVLQVALAIGISQGWTYYTKQMRPIADTFFVAVGQNDATTARSVMTTAASADLTDERLASFARAIEATHGKPTRATTDLREMFESFAQVYSGSRRRTVVQGAPSQSNAAPIPFRIDTDTGSFIGVAVFDGASFASGGTPKLLDAMAILSDGQAVCLRDGGPAELEAAGSYGVVIISHAEAVKSATKTKPPAPPANSGANTKP